MLVGSKKTTKRDLKNDNFESMIFRLSQRWDSCEFPRFGNASCLQFAKLRPGSWSAWPLGIWIWRLGDPRGFPCIGGSAIRLRGATRFAERKNEDSTHILGFEKKIGLEKDDSKKAFLLCVEIGALCTRKEKIAMWVVEPDVNSGINDQPHQQVLNFPTITSKTCLM